MKRFPTIENFLENAFYYEDLNELTRYLKDIRDGFKNKPLNIHGERNCGKTVLARLLKEMFKDDAVIISSDTFLSCFNNRWADKKLVIIDEHSISEEVIGKILKTYESQNIIVETKGKNPREVSNDITFILFTNIPFFNKKIDNMNMMIPIWYNKMVDELPAFAEYIKYYKP